MQGTGTVKNAIVRNENRRARIERSISEVTERYLTIANKQSPFYGMPYSSKIFSRTDILAIDQDSTLVAQNNFHYTDDIPRSKRHLGYRVKYSGGSSGGSSGDSDEVVTINSTQFTPIVDISITDYSKGLDYFESVTKGYLVAVKNSPSDTTGRLVSFAGHFINFAKEWSRSLAPNAELWGDPFDLDFFVKTKYPAGFFQRNKFRKNRI